MLVSDSSTRAVGGTRLVLLGGELLLATRRWPGLARGLYERFAQQTDRLATQLVICQLPRVDQRLLALMWLLAESWGRVTASGTTLPLKLTHDVLGALIGARRPTVTLALRDLAERGAVVKRDQGWLLLEPPRDTVRPVASLRSPTILDDSGGEWVDEEEAAAVAAAAEMASLSLLKDRLAHPRARHEMDKRAFDERLRSLAAARTRCQESLRRVKGDRRRRSPSRSS